MLNPFFLQGSKGEQGLVQDLVNEQLRMYGIECHYIPRKLVTSRTRVFSSFNFLIYSLSDIRLKRTDRESM